MHTPSKTTPHKPWPRVKLGDVCKIISGRDQYDVESSDGEYPIVGSGGIMGSATTYRCPPHTVYVGRKGTLDNPFMMLEPCWNIDTVFGLVAEDVLGPMYLYRFCQNTDFKKLDPASGRPSVKSSSILALEIPLPSLEEQEAIVEKLEAASRVCKAVEAQAREGLVLCEQLRTAFLREAFSDE